MSNYISSERLVTTIQKIAKREGVNITDQQILDEVFTKKQNKLSKKADNQTFLYVDGTNLLAGLIELFDPDEIPSFNSILKDINKLFKISRTYFYASYTTVIKKKFKRNVEIEAKFYKEVKDTPNLIFYKGYRSPTSGKEKGVDVHLAIDLVKGAFQKSYKQAVIITGDADLTYAVEAARGEDLPIHAVFLPNRFSRGIAHAANSSVVINYKGFFVPAKKHKLPQNLKVVKIKTPARVRTG
ncbi:MAG: Uncharacterized protein G01um101416_778 [Microgenomates group bacterium Gr01-1014_16]|nr:MAG: Uncharacterized protein G01um101416_778 [Microgenomates group bacterium Gr01-1014_16]